MISEILLIRHGITEGNKKKWFYGETDLPIIPEGIEQLTKIKEEGVYPEIPDNALCFTTGKGRTAETFRVLFGDREYGVIKELREINFGRYECKTFDELEGEQEFQTWMYDETGDYRLPEGESQNQFKARVMAGFEYALTRHNELVEQKKDTYKDKGDKRISTESEAEKTMTVVVCHGGVIAEILDNLFPKEKESKWEWMPEPGSGYLLEVENGEVKKSWEV